MAGATDIAEGHARMLAAKLSLPHMGFVLGRPRLVALLEPVRAGGLCNLVAGPGYGKTAFIVDRLSCAEGKTVYVAVDERDGDPTRFLLCLMAGLGMRTGEQPGVMPLDWSTHGGMSGAVLDLTAQIVGFAAQRTGETTLIAIDDFHVVDSSPQVVGALELIVRGLPPGWTVIVSSRRPVPLRVDKVGLGGRFVELQARELRLTPKEVTEWAVHNWRVRLQPGETRALWRLTQGWPAALVLLGQRLLSNRAAITHAEIAEVIARGTDLRAYLEQGILDGLDRTASQIMLAAGLLPRVMFPRDDAFFGGENGRAEAVLEDFVSRGYLVSRAGRRSYTVHPLVQGFAQREALQTNRATRLIDRAAEHLELMGDYYHAVTLYLRIGRLHDAARLLRGLFVSAFNMASGAVPEEWLHSLPEDILGGEGVDPWLVAAKGRVLQQRTDYEEAGRHYEYAARLLAGRGDKEGLLPLLMGSAFCLFNQGRWEEGLDVTKRCRSVAGSSREKAEVLVVEGAALVCLCRWDEAVEDWEKALALVPDDSKAALSERIQYHRGRLFYWMGHYKLARLWVERALQSSSGQGTLGRAMALNGAAVVANLAGEYERAERLADECERLVRSRGYTLLETPNLLNHALAACGRWDYRGAVTKIREAQVLTARAGDVEEGYWAESVLGDLCRRNGSPRRALEHHQNALDFVEKNRLAIFEKVQAQAAMGMDLAVLGRDDEARESLEETVRSSRRYNLKSSLSSGLFYLGWLYARAGREHEATKSLVEAVRIADEHDHIHYFSQEARVATPILALCGRFGSGSFIDGRIVPLLPDRLRNYFFELRDGTTYPTDVALGFPRRRTLLTSRPTHEVGDQSVSEVVARIATLTEREREVLKMVGQGLPNKVIGATLFISEKTVKTHTNHIFRKLEVNNRLQATLALQSYQRTNAASAEGQRGFKQDGRPGGRPGQAGTPGATLAR